MIIEPLGLQELWSRFAIQIHAAILSDRWRPVGERGRFNCDGLHQRCARSWGIEVLPLGYVPESIKVVCHLRWKDLLFTFPMRPPGESSQPFPTFIADPQGRSYKDGPFCLAKMIIAESRARARS